jgi:hypothetical protein
MTLASASPPTVIRAGANSNGDRQFAVTSESGGAGNFRLVVEVCGRLVCSCPAGHYGRACKHTSAVGNFLLEQVKQSLDRAEAARRAAWRESAPVRSNSRPFSIWRV